MLRRVYCPQKSSLHSYAGQLTPRANDNIILMTILLVSRNLPPAFRELPPNCISQDGLEIKICVRTYRLFFVSNTEDFMWKISSRDETKKAVEHLEKREKLRKKWTEQANQPLS